MANAFKTKALVARSPGAELTLEEINLHGPAKGEVIIKVVSSGICHTDISGQMGLYGPAVPFPLVLGHEAAGIVQVVGEGVTHVAKGDSVLLSFASCHKCPNCLAKHPGYCQEFLPRNCAWDSTGKRADDSIMMSAVSDGTKLIGSWFGQSSFAQYALVRDGACIVKVDPQLDLSILSILGCGILTGYGTIVNILKPTKGSSIAVIGVGAVGAAAIMGAKLSPATMIIAIDIIDARLELAKELGATHVLKSDADTGKKLRELTNGAGVNHVVEATGNPGVYLPIIATGMGLLGKAAIIGVGKHDAIGQFVINGFVPQGHQYIGVMEGDSVPEDTLPELVKLHQEGKLPIDKLIQKFKPEDANKAIEGMHNGTVIKPVIVW